MLYLKLVIFLHNIPIPVCEYDQKFTVNERDGNDFHIHNNIYTSYGLSIRLR